MIISVCHPENGKSTERVQFQFDISLMVITG